MRTDAIAKSKCHQTFPFCPTCGRTGVKGPIDAAPCGERFEFTRTFYCPMCWWKTVLALFDDAAYARAMAERDKARRTKTTGAAR